MWDLLTSLTDKFCAAITECLNKLFLNEGFMSNAVQCLRLQASITWVEGCLVSAETKV